MNIEKKATIVAMSTAFGLAVMKFFVGIFSWSIAIMSSAVDSLLDMMVSVFNTIAVHNSEKNPDKNFNYGRGKIEALAAFLEGLVIFASAIYIFYESVIKILHKEGVTEFNLGFIVMIISFVVTGILVIFLSRVARKTKNLIIESDALHYKTDLFTNGGIIVGMLIMKITGLSLIDAILGLIIALYITHSAMEILKEWFVRLLDVSLDTDEVEKIQKIFQSSKRVKSVHELRTRSSGNVKFIEAHLVFDMDISLLDAHEEAHRIEDDIRLLDNENIWSITFHLDPFDDTELDWKNKIK